MPKLILVVVLLLAGGVSNRKDSLKVLFSEPHYLNNKAVLRSLTAHELRNTTLALYFHKGTPGTYYKLRNGKAEGKLSDGFGGYYGGYEVEINAIYFPDKAHAILEVTEFTGSGSSTLTGFVQVVSLVENRLKVEQEIRYDKQSPNARAVYSPVSRKLRVRGRSEEIAHCCPTAEDEAKFAWDGSKFILQNWERIPLPVEPK